VSSHDIKAAVLIPRNLKPGPHPVIVNIHGGFFATGHSLFAPWFHPWQLKLAIDHGAIIISADYRLLPTANGIADQIDDLEDFWQWSRTKLPALLQRRAPGHSLDFNHLLLVGGSAGGYYAAQVALSHPNEISALAMTYPAVDLKDSIFVNGPAPGAPTILRFSENDIPSLSESLAWIEEKRKTVVSKGGFDITPYCVSLTQYGHFTHEVLEHNGVKLSTAELPLERIKAGQKLPKNV
jgi:acetyl esterase/lipase